ncbi:MAG TPA: acetyl-CoA carboxylase carboxyltransferase subunit beta [Nitrospirae bacterium]|nr:acetyl-coenzyme A carboxylase carboxyl transferase subunit beta [bacterium BMS3Abin06]HDH13250.1 acetyl-CoA carboxylase carboxyltransferase subunit beta [Nitrospirota bacterium]HDZ01782.1 acetyl-CoA carboxylase carboxyltransferase subunit beta [Nitrospirota bacterium]
MAWFKKEKNKVSKKVKVPEGLWVKCNSCKEIIYRKEVDRNLMVCPKCNYHFRISAGQRISLLADNGSFTEMGQYLASKDPLNFKDQITYKERLKDSQKKTNIKEAATAGRALIGNHPAMLVVLDFAFMGGSMGSVVGEKFVIAAEKAAEEAMPLISVASSGGARMHEGIVSLMQMAKTSASLARFKETGLPFISILADPTFGGVSASFAMLGDIIIAEPKSLIGFAGPRVIEQTIKQQLPENFQTAEFLLEHGMIDMIVNRKELKQTVIKLLSLLVEK